MLTWITGPTVEPVTVAEVRRHLRLDSTAGEPAPTAPTVGLVSPAAPGNCDNGAWRVGGTFVTADGETELGPLSAAVTVADKAVNGQLAVTVPLGGSAVTARNLYAVGPGQTVAKYAGQLANNTATAAVINLAVASLGVQAPAVNTTSDAEVGRFIASARDRAELATGRAVMTQTWDLVRDGFPAETWIEIPRPPLISITYLKYRDTAGTLQTWAATNYVVEAPAGPRCRRGRLSLAYGVSWPSTYGQAGDVVIRFVCGAAAVADVPPLLKTAMMLDIAAMDAQREQLVAGVVTELPGGARDIYRSFRSHATQGDA